MRTLTEPRWQRRGISLLWNSAALASLAAPHEVVSIRQLFALAGNWPDELPSNSGNALVVAGVDGCLDLLTPEDAERWLESDLRDIILRFQGHYGGDAALIFWLPTGHDRVRVNPASQAYTWICAAPYNNQRLDLGRVLWSGAEGDVLHILDPKHSNREADGPGWIGLHHPRLS